MILKVTAHIKYVNMSHQLVGFILKFISIFLESMLCRNPFLRLSLEIIETIYCSVYSIKLQ